MSAVVSLLSSVRSALQVGPCPLCSHQGEHTEPYSPKYDGTVTPAVFEVHSRCSTVVVKDPGDPGDPGQAADPTAVPPVPFRPPRPSRPATYGPCGTCVWEGTD